MRGPIQQLRFDQDSNFVGARNEFTITVRELENDKTQSYLTTNRCEFVMNLPYARHWEGVWERQISTTRSILNSVLTDYKGKLNMSSLRTFLYEVMAIINSRPLTNQCLNDPKSLEPLYSTSSTSKKFCQGGNLGPLTMAKGKVSGRTILE